MTSAVLPFDDQHGKAHSNRHKGERESNPAESERVSPKAVLGVLSKDEAEARAIACQLPRRGHGVVVFPVCLFRRFSLLGFSRQREVEQWVNPRVQADDSRRIGGTSKTLLWLVPLLVAAQVAASKTRRASRGLREG